MSKMDTCKIVNLYNIEETIAKSIFDGATYPWEVLPKIGAYILELGSTLSEDEYEKRGENVWIAKSAKVFPSAYIGSPCIIDENAEVRHCAFIRGSAIVGKNCVVGNSSELKNAILFNHAQCPHFNYIGDAIMGVYSHTGAGVIMSNLKSDGSNINVYIDGEKTLTDLRKFGGLLCDNVEVGCNSVILPGTIVEKNSTIYPLTRVRGIIYEDSIVKDEKTIVKKK
jgi:NDP-sugar pyrophosphorylase family protein